MDRENVVQWNTVKVKGAQSCPTLCDPMDYIVHEFSRPEHWSGQPFPSPVNLPDSGIKPRSPVLQVGSLLAEPQGKSKNTGVGSLSFLQGIFLTQELNQGLLHCRWILYQLSYQFSLMTNSHSQKEIGTEAIIVLSILQIRSRHRLLSHLSMIIDPVISRNRIQTQIYLIPVFSQIIKSSATQHGVINCCTRQNQAQRLSSVPLNMVPSNMVISTLQLSLKVLYKQKTILYLLPESGSPKLRFKC